MPAGSTAQDDTAVNAPLNEFWMPSPNWQSHCSKR
jgi:hypothetical protein